MICDCDSTRLYVVVGNLLFPLNRLLRPFAFSGCSSVPCNMERCLSSAKGVVGKLAMEEAQESVLGPGSLSVGTVP